MLRARANGKINLGLEVTGRREDGYHELVTIIQQIDLGDRLTFRPALGLTLETDDPSLAGEANLIWRAAELLRRSVGVAQGVEIVLEKNIPVAAGLGGGSADAAVTMLALNELWQIRWPIDNLARLARELGADVPFFLTGGAQLATGRGDCLEPIPSATLWAVLVRGSEIVPDKTRVLYEALRSEDFSDGGKTREIVRALCSGRPVDSRMVTSSFQRVTTERFPEVAGIFAAVQTAGGHPVLCGAGPTVMSLHDDDALAGRVAEGLRGLGMESKVVRTVADNPWRAE